MVVMVLNAAQAQETCVVIPRTDDGARGSSHNGPTSPVQTKTPTIAMTGKKCLEAMSTPVQREEL